MARSFAVMKFWSPVALACFAIGCQASVKTNVKTSAEAQADAEDPFDGVRGEGPRQARVRSNAAAPELDEESAEFALLGARHDVYLKSEQSATCQCLGVVAGPAADPRFVWESKRPQLDVETQLLVAFSSDDQPCEASGPPRVAAYKGYKKVGNDVVVMVEAAKTGRPAITAAVVPRPQGEGRLLVQPALQELPFGQPLGGGKGLCEIAELPSLVPETQPVEAQVEESEETDALLLAPNLTDLGEPGEDPEDETNPENFSEYGKGSRSKRDGVYFSILAGVAYASLDREAAGANAPALSAVPLSFRFLLGGSPIPNLAVGAIVGGAAGSDPKLDGTGVTPPPDTPDGTVIDGTLAGTTLNVLQVGAFADYYFVDDANLHGLADINYSSVSLSGDNATGDDLSGPGFGVGLGYDFWLNRHWSLGLLAHFMYAPLSASSSDETATLILPSVSASLTFH